MTALRLFSIALIMNLLLAAPLFVRAQDVKVRAGFVSDSTKVGEVVSFYLATTYPLKNQIVFPDSTYAFTPFELTRKEYFSTKTRDSLSYDSAVYFLRTFEIDKYQSLRLPVFVINPLDCTRVYSNRDTIALSFLVTKLPEELTADLPLKATTAYQHVPKQVNWPMIGVISSFAFILAAIGWVILGPSIKRNYRIKKLQRQHQQFVNAYSEFLGRLQIDFSPAVTESAIVTWKKYMEEISRKPFTKLTTKETLLLEQNEKLANDLRTVDTAIYGYNRDVVPSLHALKKYADEKFNHILEEVKNG
jgi:hypothetical protein